MRIKNHPGYTIRYREDDLKRFILEDGAKENTLFENHEININNVLWDESERVLLVDIDVLTKVHS